MTDCGCEGQSSRRLTMSACTEMFVYADSDEDSDDAVTRRSMSFRRCPVIRGPRRSFLQRSSVSETNMIVSPQHRTAPKHFTNGI